MELPDTHLAALQAIAGVHGTRKVTKGPSANLFPIAQDGCQQVAGEEREVVLMRRSILLLVVVVGLLVGPLPTVADSHLITWRFAGPAFTFGLDGADFVEGEVVFDPTVAPVDIRREIDLGERVSYPGAAISLSITAGGFTRQLTGGDIVVWNDFWWCTQYSGTVCYRHQFEGDRLYFLFLTSPSSPVVEDGQLIAFDLSGEFLSSIVLPSVPPEGAERIDFFYFFDDLAGTERDISSNHIAWVTQLPFDVSGTVSLDGVGLADVEVFLADGQGGQSICTNEDGSFEFEDVPEVSFVATGPAVYGDCSNQKFVDDDGNPLVATYAFGEPVGEIELDVERLPQDHPGVFHQLKTALYNCYDHSGGATADILEDFGSRLDEAWAAGQKKLSQETFDIYHAYAETLAIVMDGVCSQA